jgi:hypothetical protein
MRISIFFTIISLILSAFGAGAQAILPTSWGFDTAIPQGWSESLGTSNTRYANGFVQQACRLDATGDYVQIQFAEEPGTLTYYLKGQNSGGAWQGTFTVQQSADGVNFTALRTLGGDLPTASFTQFSDSPASTARFIRFFFTNKVSGHNVGLDEISLQIPVAGDEQEINVQFGSGNVPSGFQASVGNAGMADFTIQNLGLAQALTVSGIAISGQHASEFSVINVPSSLAPQGSSDFTLLFSPVGEGSRFCTLEISSNDASEPVYLVHIYAIAGDYATEPSAQASGLSFPNLVSWDHNVSFSAGTPAAERYIVFRSTSGPVTAVPQDGTTYVRGEWLDGSQVVYNGPAGTFNARGVTVSTAYHFAVYAVNGPAGYENYLTASPLAGTVTTPGPNIGNYYNGVNHQDAGFISDLTAALNPSNYFQVFYSNYISTLIDNFYVLDTAINDVPLNMVKCQYSGVPYTYSSGFQFWNGQGAPSLSREHTYPQSWMPTYFDPGFDDSPEVSDLHNLLPVLQEECNEVRSNFPYGEVVTPTAVFMGTAIGDNSIGQRVYAPREAIRGDVSRSVMYQATKYHTSQNDFSLPEQISLITPYGQNEYILKKWHFEDLPDGMELAKNEYIRTQQNNRNAFVDSVHFPCFIRFSNMTRWEPQFVADGNELTALDPGLSYQWYLDGEAIEGADGPVYSAEESGLYALEVQQFDACPAIRSAGTQVVLQSVEMRDETAFAVRAFPNPTSGHVRMQVLALAEGQAEVTVHDAAGRLVHRSAATVKHGENMIPLQLGETAGIYAVTVAVGSTAHTVRIVVQ